MNRSAGDLVDRRRRDVRIRLRRIPGPRRRVRPSAAGQVEAVPGREHGQHPTQPGPVGRCPRKAVNEPHRGRTLGSLPRRMKIPRPSINSVQPSGGSVASGGTVPNGRSRGRTVDHETSSSRNAGP